jgi:hypothetical protein
LVSVFLTMALATRRKSRVSVTLLSDFEGCAATAATATARGEAAPRPGMPHTQPALAAAAALRALHRSKLLPAGAQHQCWRASAGALLAPPPPQQHAPSQAHLADTRRVLRLRRQDHTTLRRSHISGLRVGKTRILPGVLGSRVVGLHRELSAALAHAALARDALLQDVARRVTHDRPNQLR